MFIRISLSVVWSLLLSFSSHASNISYHPMCLEKLHSSDWNQPFNMQACIDESVNLDPVESAVFFRISGGEYTTHIYSRPDKEQTFTEGWVATTIPIETDNLIAVEYIDNRGGTAQMSSVFILEKLNDGLVQMMAYAPFGDRCNDGGAELVSSKALGDTETVISTSATPFRLINPTNRYNWRFEFFNRGSSLGEFEDIDAYIKQNNIPSLTNLWLPYDDIANGAGSCSGFIFWSFNQNTLVWEARNVHVHDSSFSESATTPELDECINSWFTSATNSKTKANNDYFEISIKDWLYELRRLEKKCRQGEGLDAWFEQ